MTYLELRLGHLREGLLLKDALIRSCLITFHQVYFSLKSILLFLDYGEQLAKQQKIKKAKEAKDAKKPKLVKKLSDKAKITKKSEVVKKEEPEPIKFVNEGKEVKPEKQTDD